MHLVMSEKEKDLSHLLATYEDVIDSLEHQIDSYRKEHEYLKSELIKVVNDNHQLNDTLDKEFVSKLTSLKQSVIEEAVVKNLKDQLDINLLERTQLVELCELSKGKIKSLQSQLKEFVSNPTATVSALNAKIDNLTFELKLERAAREEEAMKAKKFEAELAKLKVLLDDKQETLTELEKRVKDYDEKYSKSRQELNLLNSTLECVTKTRDDLELLVDDQNRKAAEYQIKTAEAKNKVEEVLEVAERAVAERDSLQQSLKYVIEEAGVKLRSEVELVRKKHNEKLMKVLKDLSDLDCQMKNKEHEFENMKLRCKQLEEAGSSRLDMVEVQQQLIVLQNERDLANVKIRELRTVNETLINELETVRAFTEKHMQLLIDLELQVQQCRCVYLRNKLKQVKGSYRREKVELEEELNVQLGLNAKWAEEMSQLTQTFEERIEAGIQKLKVLKNENKMLRTRLERAGIDYKVTT